MKVACINLCWRNEKSKRVTTKNKMDIIFMNYFHWGIYKPYIYLILSSLTWMVCKEQSFTESVNDFEYIGIYYNNCNANIFIGRQVKNRMID